MNTDPILSVSALSPKSNLGSSRGAVLSPPTSSPASPSISSPQQADDVQRAAQDANQKLRTANIDLQFQVDLEPTGAVRSVKLLDPSTNKVVFQFPSEDMLAIRDRVDAFIAANQTSTELPPGLLFSKTS